MQIRILARKGDQIGHTILRRNIPEEIRRLMWPVIGHRAGAFAARHASHSRDRKGLRQAVAGFSERVAQSGDQRCPGAVIGAFHAAGCAHGDAMFHLSLLGQLASGRINAEKPHFAIRSSKAETVVCGGRERRYRGPGRRANNFGRGLFGLP